MQGSFLRPRKHQPAKDPLPGKANESQPEPCLAQLQLLYRLLSRQLLLCKEGNFKAALECYGPIEQCLQPGDQKAISQKINENNKRKLKEQCAALNQEILAHFQKEKDLLAKEYLGFQVEQELLRLRLDNDRIS